MTGEENNEKKDPFGVVEDRIIGAKRKLFLAGLGTGPKKPRKKAVKWVTSSQFEGMKSCENDPLTAIGATTPS